MTWMSLARVAPLNHPGLNNSRGQIPDQITQQPLPPPPHHLHHTDTIKCSRLFEMPPAVLTSEPLLTGSEYSTYMQTKALLRKAPGH
ncbi:hypothetical protein CesoFtcFv8_005987 [Champsocephalus esox]|uniref:Uncharacterized protein n=1 Tax=Champsocephalus esox TaxID=159716 RepID=A0AAN8H9F7_9TELE|nr:hypothetical protein CesoFtcFv8_005987 [Champsocephalus esox]